MKRNFNKKLVIAMTLCIGILSLSGCSEKSKTLEDYKSAGKIVMGTNAQFPPFEYHDKDEITGFDVEISKKIADKIGVKLVIEDMNFEGLISALNSKKIDFIAAGMTVTEDKKKNVDFSQGYYNSTQAIIVMKDNTQIKGKADLENKKIGAQIGTTGKTEADKIKGATVSPYDAGYMAVMDMQNGKLDAVVLDLEPSKNLALANSDIMVLDEVLTEEEYAIALRKGETELQSIINEVLSEMKENGEYEQLKNKYFEE